MFLIIVGAKLAIYENRNHKILHRAKTSCYIMVFEVKNSPLYIIIQINYGACVTNKPVVDNPSCLQTTVASALSHRSSQTVPHTLLWQYSTRPSKLVAPPTSLTAPSSKQSIAIIIELVRSCISCSYRHQDQIKSHKKW